MEAESSRRRLPASTVKKRYTAKHVKTGEPVYDGSRGMEAMTQSEAGIARSGVLLKHLARKAGVWNGSLTEHENDLLSEVCNDYAWCGNVNGERFDKYHGDMSVKALIDDNTSGGLELVPIEYDADLISFPLLNGELYPLADIKPVPRGRRMEGASVETPTVTWGADDGTSAMSSLDIGVALD